LSTQWIAAMPLLKPSPKLPPSSAAMFRSIAVRVGLCDRE
jgi:hypothetical protein